MLDVQMLLVINLQVFYCYIKDFFDDDWKWPGSVLYVTFAWYIYLKGDVSVCMIGA